MVIILVDPSQTELEGLKLLFGEQKLGELYNKNIMTKVESSPEWIDPITFSKVAEEKGYRCSQSISRRRLANRFGISYRKTGKEIWFKNELHKIPNK